MLARPRLARIKPLEVCLRDIRAVEILLYGEKYGVEGDKKGLVRMIGYR